MILDGQINGHLDQTQTTKISRISELSAGCFVKACVPFSAGTHAFVGLNAKLHAHAEGPCMGPFLCVPACFLVSANLLRPKERLCRP